MLYLYCSGGLLTGYRTEQSQYIEDNFVQPGDPSLEQDLQVSLMGFIRGKCRGKKISNASKH